MKLCIFLEWEGVSNCEVALLAEAALPRSTALLRSPTNPAHPPTTLYKGRATLALNFIIVPHALILKFCVAKIVKFQLHYKSALYFAKIPVKF